MAEQMRGSQISRPPAVLVTEDGFILSGKAYGAPGSCLGSLQFNTAITGYQDLLCEPERAGQLLVFTAPHIGNTGMTAGRQITVSGVIVRDPARPAAWQEEPQLEDILKAQDVVGICEVDTRALTLHVRDNGPIRGGIFSGADLPLGAATGVAHALDELVNVVKAAAEAGKGE